MLAGGQGRDKTGSVRWGLNNDSGSHVSVCKEPGEERGGRRARGGVQTQWRTIWT